MVVCKELDSEPPSAQSLPAIRFEPLLNPLGLSLVTTKLRNLDLRIIKFHNARKIALGRDVGRMGSS
jgi:hypothetical protein